MDSKIIEFLKKEGYPCSALQISKGVGKMTAEDVNPTLHRLWNEGCIQRMATEGQEALWFLIKEDEPSPSQDDSSDRPHSSSGISNALTSMHIHNSPTDEKAIGDEHSPPQGDSFHRPLSSSEKSNARAQVNETGGPSISTSRPADEVDGDEHSPPQGDSFHRPLSSSEKSNASAQVNETGGPSISTSRPADEVDDHKDSPETMDLHFNPKSDLYTTYSDKIPTKIVNDLEKSEISVDSTRTPCQGKRNDEPRLWSDDARKDVQFVLVTANQNEYDSLKSFLGHSRMPTVKGAAAEIDFTGDEMLDGKIAVPYDALCGNYLYFRVFGKESKKWLDVAVMKCVQIGSSGHHGSRKETLQLLFKACKEKWHPQAIFIIGCCGSPTNEVGTVLVASGIIHYNKGKLTPGRMEWNPDTPYTSETTWIGNIQRVQQMGDHARRVVLHYANPILSGDYVVKCQNAAGELSQLVPNSSTVGIEMESVGVAEAVETAKLINAQMPLPPNVTVPLPEFVIVKGVSDLPGITKNDPCDIQFFDQLKENVGEDERQQMCTIMAATLVLRAIVQLA